MQLKAAKEFDISGSGGVDIEGCGLFVFGSFGGQSRLYYLQFLQRRSLLCLHAYKWAISLLHKAQCLQYKPCKGLSSSYFLLLVQTTFIRFRGQRAV